MYNIKELEKYLVSMDDKYPVGDSVMILKDLVLKLAKDVNEARSIIHAKNEEIEDLNATIEDYSRSYDRLWNGYFNHVRGTKNV